MESNTGNIVSIHFQAQRLYAHIDKCKINKNGGVSGVFAEIICSDRRFGERNNIFDTLLVDQIVKAMNDELFKASIRISTHKKGAITGVAVALGFEKIGSNDIPEPSFTWKAQLVSACVRKLAEFGYEFQGEAKNQECTSFYFVEKRGVLNALLGPA